MRVPLKYQIMVPMLCVMLATLALVSIVDAWMAGNRARQRIEWQLRDIGATLAHSTFPLTDGVLKQMRGLSGAEFVVADQAGTVIAASESFDLSEGIAQRPTSAAAQSIALDHRVHRNNKTYFHVPLDLDRPTVAGQSVTLHCFYPESDYQQAWREAVWPPVALGMMALLLVVVISRVIAMRVTHPIRRLRDQVDRIARGDFVPLAVPMRNDELRDLSIAVNRMAEMLTQYEGQVRSNERLRTLDRLGGGIAHQLRNSVTGCRIAVDLHQRRCPVSNDESIPVAIQQLELMEEYLRRFLSLGKQTNRPFVPVDIAEVVENILPLVRPRIDHLGIVLQWHRPEEPLIVNGDADALSQVIVNLLINAAEAAAQCHHRQDAVAARRLVGIRVVRTDNARVRLEVSDSGPGPAEQLQHSLFEPMVSDKHDGVGLGLAIVRETVEHHGGTVQWRRCDDTTCFCVELPMIGKEIRNADVACCR